MKKILLIICFMLLVAMPTDTQAAKNYVYEDINASQNEILQKLFSQKILDGYEDKFYPSTEINRVQMAIMLSNAYDLKPIRAAANFSDVSKYFPYYREIQALYRAGILDGSNGKFNPYEPVRRSHAAKVFTNLLKLELKQTTKFKDVPVTSEYNGRIGALVEKGIIQGYQDGTFKMTNNVTKMQFATMVYRSLFGKESTPVKKRTIKSNEIFAPTKLASAKIRVGYANKPYEVTMNFNKNGDTNLGNTIAQPYIYYSKESIRGGQDSTDYIYFIHDLRGLVEDQISKIPSMYGTYYKTLTFDEKATVAGETMTGLVKLSSYDRSRSDTWDYYLKEGYGVVYITLNGKPYWEILSMKLR